MISKLTIVILFCIAFALQVTAPQKAEASPVTDIVASVDNTIRNFIGASIDAQHKEAPNTVVQPPNSQHKELPYSPIVPPNSQHKEIAAHPSG